MWCYRTTCASVAASLPASPARAPRPYPTSPQRHKPGATLSRSHRPTHSMPTAHRIDMILWRRMVQQACPSPPLPPRPLRCSPVPTRGLSWSLPLVWWAAAPTRIPSWWPLSTAQRQGQPSRPVSPCHSGPRTQRTATSTICLRSTYRTATPPFVFYASIPVLARTRVRSGPCRPGRPTSSCAAQRRTRSHLATDCRTARATSRCPEGQRQTEAQQPNPAAFLQPPATTPTHPSLVLFVLSLAAN